jgi:hypothetical protein
MIEEDWITPIKKLDKKTRQSLIFANRVILARKYFYYYCKALFPKYYTDDTPYLRDFCNKLQKIYEGKLINKKTGDPIRRIMINMPPRHFKSLTVQLFEQWTMGKDNSTSVITACYNTKLSTKFARGVRDSIAGRKQKGSRKILFNDIFPNVYIKKGYGGVGEWALNNNDFNFLASSFGATLTGFGCKIGVIDDQINSAIDAKNDNILAENWEWFCDTFLSRLEGDSILIVNMTRWSNHDICGMLQESGDIDNWLIIKYEACDLKTGEMLNHHVLNRKQYEFKRRMTSHEVFMANYHQKPVDARGRLYKTFKTYETLPQINMAHADIRTIIDPSDGKNDNLCAITYLVYNECAYILDIYYVDKKELMSSKLLSDFIVRNGSRTHKVERNKGEIYGEDIARHLKSRCYDFPNVDFFWSKDTKATRITNSASWVQEIIFYPKNWEIKYSRFCMDIKMFYGNGKDKTDDAADVLSMIKEDIINEKKIMGQAAAFIIKGENIYEKHY